LKILLFTWLMLENKILTSDNFLKRGGIGPNIYVMCISSVETVSHLTMDCSFSKEVWSLIRFDLYLTDTWGKTNLQDNLKDWLTKAREWKELPLFVCWEIWKQRNSMMFENGENLH